MASMASCADLRTWPRLASTKNLVILWVALQWSHSYFGWRRTSSGVIVAVLRAKAI